LFPYNLTLHEMVHTVHFEKKVGVDMEVTGKNVTEAFVKGILIFVHSK